MNAHESDVVWALYEFRNAVLNSDRAKDHGTHGDGRVEAALAKETAKYHALLALVAPETLERIQADMAVNMAHYSAMGPATGMAVVDTVHSLVNAAVSR